MAAAEHLALWLGVLCSAEVVLEHASPGAWLSVPLMRVTSDAHCVAPENHLVLCWETPPPLRPRPDLLCVLRGRGDNA